MSENAKSSQNKWQKFIFIILGGVLGVVLLLFGNAFESDSAETVASDSDSSYADADAYADMLEQRVADICSGVAGAGEVRVFVSLKGGYRTVYAVDSQSTSSGYRNEVVMSGSGSDKAAVVAAYENPEIAGVGIVCSGADNAQVRAQIIALVSAALDIGSNKIYVAS